MASASSSTNNTCDICCEPFNKSTNALIKCINVSCNCNACKSCVRTYLLGTTEDPHCMGCKTKWNQEFLTFNLNRCFVEKELKNHRKELLVEREMSKMPETMPLVENTILIRNIEKENQEIKKKIAQLKN